MTAASLVVTLGQDHPTDDAKALADAYLAWALTHTGETVPWPASRALRHRYLPEWSRARTRRAYAALRDAGLLRPPRPGIPQGHVIAPIKPGRLLAHPDRVTVRVETDNEGSPDYRKFAADLARVSPPPPGLDLVIDLGTAAWPHDFVVHELAAAIRARRIPPPTLTTSRTDVLDAWRTRLDEALA